MTSDQFYKKYAQGRSRKQFDLDSAAFFGSLAAANAKPVLSFTGDNRSRAVNKLLKDTAAIGAQNAWKHDNRL